MTKDKCNIDLSRYVALGDSITTGYMDGALSYEGQQHCFPAILVNQFRQKHQLAFKQPLMRPESVGVNQDGESMLILKLGRNSKDFILTHLAPQGDSKALTENSYAKEGPFQNMGVPGAKVITMLMPAFGNSANGTGNFNPFFTRMASDPLKASILSDVLSMNPTFFSLFIGNNDALAFALSGGTLDAITSSQAFENSLRTLLSALTQKGAKGIIANLPTVADIPYFTSIPYNGLFLSESEAASLNHQYIEAGLHFEAGTNSFAIVDPLAQPYGVRFVEKGELITMDVMLDKEKDVYLSGKKPIPKKYSLSHLQLSAINNANKAYNKIIEAVSKEKQLAFVDIRALLKTAKPDRSYNSSTHNFEYTRKGIFSLDGLHPNSFGQALMANEFIRVINETFGCDFATVRSHRYRGIVFPQPY